MPKKYTILVCRGPECGDKRHSADVHAAFKRELASCPLDGNSATLDLYSCFGKCQRGVNVLVRENLPTDNPMMLKLIPGDFFCLPRKRMVGSGDHAVCIFEQRLDR